MLSENELDNILVRQKDLIWKFVHARRYAEAQFALRVVSELWEALNYAYKEKEIRTRMSQMRPNFPVEEPDQPNMRNMQQGKFPSKVESSQSRKGS